MSGEFIPRKDVYAVNWIIRRIGVGVALIAMIVAVVAIVEAFCAVRHGMPLGSGLIWVKE